MENSFFVQWKAQILKQDLWECLWSCRSLAQGHWSCRTIHWNSFLYSFTYEKTWVAVHFTRWWLLFLSICWQKRCEFDVKIFSVFLKMQTKFLFFFLHKILNSTDLSSKLSLTYGGNVKACECYFYQVFIFSPNDGPSETMKNVFYFI